MVDDFIERKHGRKKVEYPHPSVEPLLKDTYGVIVYQEQVMQIASAMAGYSLGGADLLRRAMGKKKAEVMDKEKEKFLKGAGEKQVAPGIAESVFDLMAKFAGYGFNRSHSAAYGLLTYQTAYLKRYFPVQFFAALMTCDKDSTDAVVKFIAEAREQGIGVERPDVNESDADFTVVPAVTAPEAESSEKKKPEARRRLARRGLGVDGTTSIRFGLAAVKGVGEGAVEAIKDSRAQAGPFLSVTDFCNRVDGRKVNRKVIEALVKSGAFDGVAGKNRVSRARLYLAIGPAMERAVAEQRERESGQTNLLALLGGGAKIKMEPAGDAYAEGDEWGQRELLAFEKESLGFYISGHPLDRFEAETRRFANATTATCMARGPRSEVVLAGIVCDYQERQARSGNGKYAFFKLEDQLGQIEFSVGAAKVAEFRELLVTGEPLLVRGTVDTPFGDEETVRERLRFADAKPLSSVRAERSTMMEIRLNADAVSEQALVELEKVLRTFEGSCRTRLLMEIPQRSQTTIDLPDDYRVPATEEVLSKIEQLFGPQAAVLR